MLIGNARRADLLQCRLDTLELMKWAAEKLKWERDPTQRAELMAFLKEMGQISQEYTRMIEHEDKNGADPKWANFYRIKGKLDASQKVTLANRA